MASTGMILVKNCLFMFNLFFFLAGIGLIVTGALVQTKFRPYFTFSESMHLTAVGLFLILVGVVIFVIGFFGCCGAYKENYCMIMTFAVLLGTVFIFEIAASITVYLMKNDVHGVLQKHLVASMTKYDISGGVTKAWDALQKKFKCCGLTNFTNWRVNGKLSANSSVPDSCCIDSTTNCGVGKLRYSSPPGIYTASCLKKFIKFLEKNIYAIGGVGIAFALLQVIGVVTACYFAHHIKKEYEVV